MDTTELWAARMKRQLVPQSSQYVFESDELDDDESVRTEFECPYCSEEYDIATLCTHMEDEHCEARLTLCPVCSLRIGGNEVVSHITSQHAALFKCRKRIRKPSLTARLQNLLGVPIRPPSNNNTNTNTASSTSAADAFLSSLVSAINLAEEENSKPSVEKQTAAAAPDEKTLPRHEEDGLTREERERRNKQASSRAQFVQHIVMSSFWSNS